MDRIGITSWHLSLPAALACCAALFSVQGGGTQSAPQRSSHTSILAHVVKDLGQPWLQIDAHLRVGEQFRVSKQTIKNGPVRLIVDGFGGLTGDTIDIDLWKTDDQRLWIEASIVWKQDIQPFKTPWEDVGGQVWVSSMDWTGEAPVIVHFDLHGTRDDKEHSASGEVTLPR